jgi:phosphatidylinositol 4-kinase
MAAIASRSAQRFACCRSSSRRTVSPRSLFEVSRRSANAAAKSQAEPGPGSTSLHDYNLQNKDRVRILTLLVESEISRLGVWCNPTNETGRSPVQAGNIEKRVTQVSPFIHTSS